MPISSTQKKLSTSSDSPLFRIRIPNANLRKFVAYRLQRELQEDHDTEISLQKLGDMQIPLNLDRIAAAIDLFEGADVLQAFEASLRRLDEVVAEMFGMSSEQLEYIISAMTTDGFLSQLRPSYEHRGLRIQPYADHGETGRY